MKLNGTTQPDFRPFAQRKGRGLGAFYKHLTAGRVTALYIAFYKHLTPDAVTALYIDPPMD